MYVSEISDLILIIIWITYQNTYILNKKLNDSVQII